MKNIFRFLMAVAVLFTASCAKEDISSSIGGGEVEVTFTANLPELGTRAYADGTNANILYYNVYDAATDTLLQVSGSKELDADKLFIVNIPMLKGMTYDIVFWAENKDGGYYTLNGKEITVNFENGKKDANDNKRDAFYAYVENFDPTAANADTTIELYRPFGQLNAATNDYAAVENNDVTLTESSLIVTTFSKLNLETGVATEPVAVTFDATAMPCMLTTGEEILMANYKYLSMNYLVPGTVDAEFTFKGTRSNGSEIVFTGTKYSAVPLKANYRTNILGALLTKPTEFTVEVKPGFDEPAEEVKVVSVSTASELQEVINAINEATPVDGQSTEIVLEGDINLNDLLTRAAEVETLVIPAGKEIVLNLNGCTLSKTKECTGNYNMILNKGKLTITGNGKISFKDTGAGDPSFGWGSYTLRNEGTLVVENGTIEHLGEQNPGNGQPNVHMYCAIFQYSGSSIINGGTISTPTYRSARLWNGDMTINGGNFVGQLWLQAVSDNNANLTINGGTFAPCGNDGSSVFVSNGSYAVDFAINGGTFTTKIGMSTVMPCVNGGAFVNLANAIEYAAQGAVISPAENLELSEVISVDNGKDITLDLAGKTISGTDNGTASFGLFTNKGNLTINDSVGGGKIQLTATNNRGWNAYSSVISNQPGGVLTVNGGTIEHLGGTDMAYGIDNLTNGKGTAAVATINGGTVKSTYRAVRQFLNGVEANNSLTINGGTIEGANKSVWMQDPSKNANTGTLTVGANAQLKGDVYLYVCEGSTEWPVSVSIAEAALQGESTVVTGNVPDLYEVKVVDGAWTVKEATYQDFERKLNRAHTQTSYISVSTGNKLLPYVAAVMPEICGYSVFDGDTRITDKVVFRFFKVKKENIDENSYKVSFVLAIKDDKGNDLELKPGMPSTINGKEYLHVYVNLLEIPAGYDVTEVKVNGTALTLTTNTSGNLATGEYWLGYDHKDVYLQTMTAGKMEFIVSKTAN